MTGPLMTVLYEDQIAVQPTSYGPHMLVLACVADRVGGDPWALRARVVGIAKKGDSKLRAALRDDGGRLAKTGPLVALFDDDRVRTCFGVPKGSCKRVVLDMIAKEASGRPTIVLLERNMEDVIAACAQALGQPAPSGKPRPAERDAILLRAAAAEVSVRASIVRAVPSFERLVRTVHAWLGA